uniref:Uncharacterized protein n=1 Tax=Rhizophora mucronata TaxID=61149 RepID=A0A2P2PR88_RHIMU
MPLILYFLTLKVSKYISGKIFALEEESILTFWDVACNLTMISVIYCIIFETDQCNSS